MDKAVKSNYLGTKFSLDNLKKDKLTIMKNSPTLKSYSVQLVGKDVLQKVYYDTPDFYLFNRGIVVNINSFKGKSNAELVVRYESEKKRIAFLSNIPDTFAITIPAKANILNYSEFIAEAISNLLPNGIEVDAEQFLHKCAPVFKILKKRESYRVIHINGLKCMFFFSQAEYSTSLNRRKTRLELFEIESSTINLKNDYDMLVKLLKFEFPKLIEIEHSDFIISKENLLN